MSIFSTPVIESTLGVKPSTEFIEPTLEGVQDIIMEATEKSFALEASLYVSDIIASQQVCEGASTEAVLEGFAGSAMAKLKALWQKLWAKVQSWFKGIIKRVQLIFQSGSKLVDTFGKELRQKSTVGFKYKGYKYKVSEGEKQADTLIAALEAEFNDKFKIAVNATNSGNAGDVVSASWSKSGKSELTAEDVIKGAANKVDGSDTISEATEKIVKTYRGNEDAPEEIENFAAASVDAMLNFVKTGKNEVGKLNRAKSETDDKFKKVISTIDKAAKEFVKTNAVHAEGDTDDQKTKRNETAAKMSTYFSKVVTILQQVVSGILSVHGVKIKMYEEVVKSYQATIKKFATFKAKKDSVNESTTEDEEEDDSILESAYRLF